MAGKLSAFDAQVRDLDDARVPASWIAYRLSVSRCSVRGALSRLGREGSTYARTQKDTAHEVLRLDDEGVSTTRIAELLGITETGVRTIRRRHGRTDQSVPGRIDDATAEEIFRLHQRGQTIQDLARQYGRGRRAIKTALKKGAHGPRHDHDSHRLPGIDPDERSAIRAAYSASVPVMALVSHYQRTEESIRNIVRGLAPDRPQTTHLTQAWLRDLRRQGCSIHAIARMTGGASSAVRERLAEDGLAYARPFEDGIRLIVDHNYSLQDAAAAVEISEAALRFAAQQAGRERQALENLACARTPNARTAQATCVALRNTARWKEKLSRFA